MGNNCPRVFLEAPSCLTHSFSHRGPICVASSGLAHDGNTKETDWKWNTFLRIKEGILEFGTFAVSDCLCADVFCSGAELHSLRAVFVVFGWVSVLCKLALSLVRNLLRPDINTAAHVASVVCVGGDLCHLDSARRGTTQTPWRFIHIPSKHDGSSGSHCGFATAILPVTSSACRFDKHGMGADDDHRVLDRKYDHTRYKCCCFWRKRKSFHVVCLQD